MALKQVTRSAAVAWCPSAACGFALRQQKGEASSSGGAAADGGPQLLALGTMGVDPRLELASVDLSSQSPSLPIVASVGAPSPFQCISWGVPGSPSCDEGGLLAGGMAEGEVTLWSANEILRHGAGEGDGSASVGLLSSVLVQRGQRVQSLQFNALRPSLLAAGCSGGGVSILDVEVVEEAVAYQPGADGGSAEEEECTCLAWNSSVPHILATGTGTGQTVVWDLKQRKHAISFCDPQHRHSRPSSVIWLPSQPTQLLLVYDDDRNPSPQLWDLRNASFPLREARPQPPFGHTRGIVHASLSPADSRMVLTCGRDSRLVCWWLAEEALQQQQQHSSGIEVYLQQQTPEPYMQILWAPSMPGVYAAATPIRVSIRSLLAASLSGGAGQGGDNFYGQEDSKLMGPCSSSLLPSWFKAPRSLDFAFGDRVAFSAASGRTLSMLRAEGGGDSVEGSLSGDAQHAALAAEVQQLDGQIRQQQWMLICMQQLQQLEQQQQQQQDEVQERELWSVLLSALEGRTPSLGGCSREELLQQLESLLGHPLPSVIEEQRQLQQQQQQMAQPQQMEQQPMYGAAYGMQQQQQQQHGYMNGYMGYPGYPTVNGVSPRQQPAPALSAVDPEKFFSQLGGEEERQESSEQQQRQQDEVSPQQQDFQREQQENEKAAQQAASCSRISSSQRDDIDWSLPAWRLVRECLLSGCVEGAVELLKVHGTLGDALLIAGAAAAVAAPQQQQQQQQQSNTGCLSKAAEGKGLTIWRGVTEAYVRNMQDDFLKLFGFVCLDELEGLVESLPLARWREGFRLLCSYAVNAAAFERLARRLGQRLSEAGDLQGALLCFVSTKDFPSACSIWLQQLQGKLHQQRRSSSSSSSSSFAQQLLDTLRKMLVLKAASGYQGPCSAFERIVLAYAGEASGLSCGACALLLLRLYLDVGSSSGGASAAAAARGAACNQGVDPAVHAAAVELWSRIYYNNPTAMQQAGFAAPQMLGSSPSGPGGTLLQRQQQQHQPLRPVQQQQPSFLQQQQQQPPFMMQQQQRGPGVPPPLPGVQQQQQQPPVPGQQQPPHVLPSAAAAPPPAAAPVGGPSNSSGRMQGFMANGPQRQQQPPLGPGPSLSGSPQQLPAAQQQLQQQPQRQAFSQGGGPFGQGVPAPSPTTFGAPPPPAGGFGGPTAPAGAPSVGASLVPTGAPPAPAGFGSTQGPAGSSPPHPSAHFTAGNSAGASPPYGGPSAGVGPVGSVGPAFLPGAPPSSEGAPTPAPYTAPTVGAQPVKPGMPVPWPIPTSAQLNQRATRSTYAANLGINQASAKAGDGKVLPLEQQAFVRNVLQGLLQMQQGPSGQDLSNKIEDLLQKLQQGELSSGASDKVVSLCKFLQGAEYTQAQRLHAELSATEWHSSNRQWLMALKRLIPKA